MEVCRNPEILKIILFIRQILNIVSIIVPIGLILMIGLDLFKNITASKEDEMKKNLSIAIKRIIYCVCIFFVPTIVNLVNNLVNEVLEDTKINYAACLKNADPEEIEKLTIELADEAIEKAKEKQTMAYVTEAEAAVEKIEDKTIKNERQQEIAEIKEQVIANAEANREEDEQQSHITPGSGSGSGGNNGASTVLTDGIQGKYFAPVQQEGLHFYGTQANPYDHDLGTDLGSELYAGMDGTASFYQNYTTIDGVEKLYSYGNYIYLTSEDGTKITYAHLDSFVDNIKVTITESLKYPCGVANYSGTYRKVGAMKVKRGQLIGYTGTTGNSTGPHLHVEVYEPGKGNLTDLDAAFGY